MKFNPLLIIALFAILALSPITTQAQKSLTQDRGSIQQLYDHDHGKCGADIVTDRLAQENPDYARELREFKNNIIPILSEMESNRSVAPIIYVPVVVHVIHNGEAIGVGANLSEEQIQAQIDVLNEDFSAMNANYNDTPAQWQDDIGNPEIQFCLAIIDPDGDGTNGITRHNIAVTGTNINNSNIEDEIKPATWWDSNEYYNIYTLAIPGTTAGGGTTGYAYYPTNGMIGSDLDGSVVDYRWFGGPGFSQSGSGTLTHETGHYLGLPHTFNGLSCAIDDGIIDTPEIDSSTAYYMPGLNCNASFPTGPVSCGNEHMYVNYMDYVNDDDCSTSFTNGQINVMRAVLEGTTLPSPFNYGSRLPLAQNATTVCTFFDNDAGIARIKEPTSNICGDGQITPTVTLQNYGRVPLTTVTISYQINGGTPVDFIWIDVLGTGGTQDVALAPYTPPVGIYTFSATISFPNGTADEQTSNDEKSVDVTTVVPTNLPLNEGFEDTQWNPTTNGVFHFNISGDAFEWERTTAVSGYGIGGACALFNNFAGSGGANPNGTTDALITSVYDFTAITTAELSFDMAYAPYDGSFFDSLKIYASTDCGSTFDDLLFSNGNEGLATAPATTGIFTPTVTQWATHTIDLSAYDNVPNLTIAFINQSGYGNRLFIDNINISSPTACSMTLEPVAGEIICNGICDGTASVSITNGTDPVSYQWGANAGNATSAIVEDLCPGTYSVTVTDGMSCTAETMVTLTEPSAMILGISKTDETTAGANDGTATAIVSDGTSPYTYLWNDPLSQTTATAINLAPGVYCVSVSDANGCEVNDCITIDGIDCGGFTVNATSTAVDCNGNQNGSVNASAENGTEPYTYLWSTTDETAEVTGLGQGTYTVTTTDANGCTSVAMVTVDEPDELLVSVLATNETATNANDGTATASVSGGTGPYSYLWNDPLGQTSPAAINLSPGLYCVTITDDNGCEVNSCATVEAFDCGGFTVITSAQDVDCFGNQNGSVNASAENGTEPYNYLWNTTDETAEVNGLAQGVYSVTATDANGCTSIAIATVNEPDELTVSVSATNETSSNANDGTATAAPLGGAGSYTYSWDDPAFQITATAINLAPGTYCVTVTDNNGCTATNCAIVDDFGCGSFAVTLNTDNVTCFGFGNGMITSTAENGNEPYVYAWSNSAETANLENINPGIYVLTVTDDTGCTVVTEAEITEPDFLEVSVTCTNETSAGANDGTCTVAVSGGTCCYTEQWSNGQGGVTISNLAAGTYCVTVTDDLGCTEESCGTVSAVNCNFSIDLTVTNVTCNGFENGIAGVAMNGGTMPFTITWSTGEDTENIDGLTPGSYSVTVTDNLGCEQIEQFVITEPDVLTVAIDGTNPSTNGGMDGTATAMPGGGTPGYVFAWDTGSNAQTITGLAAGVYVVTVTDFNSCMTVNEIELEEPSMNCSNFTGQITATDLFCNGENTGSVSVDVSGGTPDYEYLWSNDETTPTILGLAAGNYSVTITDANDCELILSSEVNEPVPLSVIVTVTNPSTPGGNDGTATAMGVGGTPFYTYLWGHGESGPTATGLSQGIYPVTVTDSNGCDAIEGVIITDPSLDCNDFMISIDIVDVTCNGFENGALVVIPEMGTFPISYAWSNGAMTNVNAGLGAGIYTVTATDAAGCTASMEAIVEEPSAIEIILSPTVESGVGAGDGSITSSVSGGTPTYTYEWSNGEETPAISNLSSGMYTLTVTDENDCIAVMTTVVGVDGVDCSLFAVVDFETTSVSCFGGFDGTITAITMGGTEPIMYNWSNGATGQTIEGLQAGIYVVTATDAADCISVNEIEVEQPTAGINVDYSTTPESSSGAMDGTILVTVTGGTPVYAFDWSNGATTEDLENLAAGEYELVITDANDCVHSIVIIVPGNGIDCSSFELETQFGNVSCNQAEDGFIVVTATGGTAPIVYNWNTGAMTQSLFNIGPGLYTVTATDGNNCEVVEEFVITEPAPIDLNMIVTNETAVGANDGMAVAVASGGTGNFSYEWSNGTMVLSISDLEPGFYTVTVTDDLGCTVTETIEIQAFADFCVNFEGEIESTPIDCNGNNNGTASATATGGLPPYNFAWSNGTNSSSLNALAGGTYTVTITDENDCEIILTTVVEEPNELNVETVAYNGNCGTAGIVASLVSGGTQDYTYNWSNGSTDEFISGLDDGLYSLTVTDTNGCTSVSQATIENDEGGIEIESDVETVTCLGDADGAIEISVITGTAPFTFNWSNGAITEDLNNLDAGTYTVLITDALGCSFLTTFNVEAPAELTAGIDWTPASNGNNGTAAAIVYGGTTPYTYQWSSGANSASIQNLNIGAYTLTVTDANGCVVETSVDIGTTGTEDLSTLEKLIVSPNPSNGQFVLNAEFTTFETGIVEVYNILGQKVFADEFSSQDLTLDIGLVGQSSGSYFLVLRTKKGRAVRKLIII